MIDPRFSSESGGPADSGSGLRQLETTGRQLVVFADSGDDIRVDWGGAGVKSVADSRDFAGDGVPPETLEEADAVIFAQLGVALVSREGVQLTELRAAQLSGRRVLAVVPELVHHMLRDEHNVLQEELGYTRAYRDGVDDLAERVLHAGGRTSATAPLGGVLFEDTSEATWGIQAVMSDSAPRSGKGIAVAVLDTGFDVAHPDFVGRDVTTKSFVADEQVQDGNGHGTHCIGTACGPRTPSMGPRYGVAFESDIFVGKVLSNAGTGTDGTILAGIDWAVANRCPVISMSLGAGVAQAHPPYSAAGGRALAKGCLVIAAAGDNADRRRGTVGFVGAPANSPEIMAVGALDQRLETAFFSARSSPARGGQVDIAGPGFQVLSAWPMPTRYRSISGTSMATSHVAGVAALWAETTGHRGSELWATLSQSAERLLQPSVDVGSGMCLTSAHRTGRADRPPQVFVTSTNDQRQVAAVLLDRLRASGAVLWTAEDVEAGQDWRAFLGEQVARADSVLLVIGRNPSAHDRTEWKAVLERSWTGALKNVVPVLAPKATLPPAFADRQVITMGRADIDREAARLAPEILGALTVGSEPDAVTRQELTRRWAERLAAIGEVNRSFDVDNPEAS